MKINWGENSRGEAFTSPVRNIIFVKKPHCAGTSFQKLLEDNDEYIEKIRLIFSGQLRKLKEKYPDSFVKAFKFAIIRNPWDKFISSWKHSDLRNSSIESLLNNLPTDKRRWWHIVNTQTKILFDDNELMVDHLIRFENLENELGKLFEKLGLPPVKFPHKNKTKHKPYWEYYTDETRKKVEELFKEDIEAFGYTFTP